MESAKYNITNLDRIFGNHRRSAGLATPDFGVTGRWLPGGIARQTSDSRRQRNCQFPVIKSSAS
ncbi:MAG: hypothetical protein H6Q07_2252 [Acidobacteria bacterium]|nr:hypothetical protein [Acidobacteriota bacterium]